ncbi:MAG: TraB/GumN family protein [Massilia sp.]|nr:TraB/GumN family protein [Massilia sp.]
MRRQIIVVFLSLFCLALPSASGANRGALFKVAAHGHTMYLFGTMHVGQPGFYPLEPRIVAAVAGASTLALEIDPNEDPASKALALQSFGMAAPGANVQAMAPALRARLRKALEKTGIDGDAANKFKPWLVATVLAVAEYAAQGYRADLSVDAHLAQMARGAKVAVIGLESTMSQLSLFNRLSNEEQLRVLEESIEQSESGRQGAEVRQIVEAWRTADRRTLDEIAARIASDTSVSGKFFKKVLLDERNVAIADKLVALLQHDDKAVAAIGVLHLVGANSVPALLSARGVSVERVY